VAVARANSLEVGGGLMEHRQVPADPHPPASDRAEPGDLPTHRWLITLRWAAIAGQCGAVVGARVGLSLDLPLVPIYLLLAAEVAYNAVLSAALSRRPSWFGRWQVFAQLAVDLVALTVLLALSGGPENPFNFLYLVHVALACVVLPARHAWAIAGLSSVAFGTLFVLNVPLQRVGEVVSGHAGMGHVGMSHGGMSHGGVAMEIHLRGMWVAFVVAATFIVYFVTQIRGSLERQTAALAASRLRAERAERLASLGTLAAGAAHELATPLSSIRVAARELERAVPEDLREEASVIMSEVERCRTVLSRLSAEVGQSQGEGPRPVSLSSLIQRATAGFDGDPRLRVHVEPTNVTTMAAALETALRGIVDNALRASAPDGDVEVRAAVRDGWLTIAVVDGGTGMPPEDAARVGEPFFTTRPAGEGMGLGAFLARSVAEQLGGTLSVESVLGEGTTVTLRVPVHE
jgi:two-component system sensor histidine kinase RegB